MTILHDARNPKAAEYRKALEARLHSDLPEGLTIVIGGDGYLLRTVHSNDYEGVFLGLNAGRLGFLLNDVSSWDHVVERVQSGAYTAHAFPLLEGNFSLANGDVVTDKAINDIYLERASGQTARLAIGIDGHEVVETLVADGIVFSTALGSTAYNFSAGGMACHPTLSLLAVTPICPHHPRLSPFALPGGSRARVEVRDSDRRPVRGVTDGRELNDVIAVELQLSESKVQLAYFDDHDFTGHMVRKILHP